MNPNNFTNEDLTPEVKGLLESAKKVSLSVEEKSQIKNQILSSIQSAPMPSVEAKKDFVKTSSPYFTVHDFFGLTRHVYLAPALLLLFVFLGGGTSYYAQGSLPGDALYGVKLNLNEEVESMLTFSPVATADVNLKQATARLNEVETLSMSGNLTETQSVAIQTNFSKKVEALNKNIEKAKKKGDIEKAEKLVREFEKKIDEHFDAFVTISNSASNSPTFATIFESKRSRSGDTGIMMMSASAKVAAPTSKKQENKVEDDDRDDDSRSGDDRDDDDRDEDEDRDVAPTPPVVTPTSTTTATTTSATPSAPTVATYTLIQVSAHNKSTDCWSVVSGGVYNLTSWIAKHPGGEAAIKSMCGVDATVGFLAQHKGDSKPTATIATYKIGILK
ncbi:MAG: hypothetical protein AB198_02470 [Parcubacteria bacterium C7867-003]|nr:MAG: hypothetical protein AB198_02470 [Parcubacteria bacterium C7867-003]